jgi:hypothetical protein
MATAAEQAGDNQFSKECSAGRFWDKLKDYATAARSEIVERALQLYYAAQAPDTPK